MRKIKEETFEYYLKHPEFVNWHDVSSNKELTIDQIRRAKDHLDWYWITLGTAFTEDEIRQFQDYVYWDWVSFKNKKINESFLREFKDKIECWDFLGYAKIPKNFRREFNIKDVNHALFQQFNENEIGEFVSGEDWDKISKTFWITEQILEKFKNKLNWRILSQRYWPLRTMWKYRDYWDWSQLTSTCVLKWKEYKITKFQKYVDWNIIKHWTWKKWSTNFKTKFAKRLELN